MLRADGVPTYNFGVVVDDIDMRITHVVRGEEWISLSDRSTGIFSAPSWGNGATAIEYRVDLAQEGAHVRHQAESSRSGPA